MIPLPFVPVGVNDEDETTILFPYAYIGPDIQPIVDCPPIVISVDVPAEVEEKLRHVGLSINFQFNVRTARSCRAIE